MSPNITRLAGAKQAQKQASWLHLYRVALLLIGGCCNFQYPATGPLRAASKVIESPAVTRTWPSAVLCTERYQDFVPVVDVFVLIQFFFPSPALFMTSRMSLLEGRFKSAV